MYCSYCGKQLSDGDAFCPGCGKRVGPPEPGYNAQNYGQTPKEPPTLVPFLLGMVLGVVGILIAVLVYNGNDGPYTKNPTEHALIWSIIGVFIWVPVTFFFIFSLFFVH